jgi:hypothetical protein
MSFVTTQPTALAAAAGTLQGLGNSPWSYAATEAANPALAG